MSKYFICIALLLTSCEASVHVRMVPNCEPIMPYEEEAIAAAGWVCGSCGLYNYSHHGFCRDCGAGK